MGRIVEDTRGPVRRLLPLLIMLAMPVWIAAIVTLITLNPAPGTGNPMD
jgi:hypothetical protein